MENNKAIYMFSLLKEQIKQMNNDELLLALNDEIDCYAKQYPQDLYRASKLSLISEELKIRLLINKSISRTIH